MKPSGSNADEWHLFLCERLDNRANHPNGLTYMALQIADAIEEARGLYPELLAAAKDAVELLENTEGTGANERALVVAELQEAITNAEKDAA